MNLSNTVKRKFGGPGKLQTSPSSETPKIKKTSFGSKALVALQRLGKSLMFPIAILPFAALMNRLGDLISYFGPTYLLANHSGDVVYWIGQIVHLPGATIFNNIALIFGIGVAFGLSKDSRGEAALVGGAMYLILLAMTAEGTFPGLIYGHILQTKDTGLSELLYVGNTYVLDTGVLGGITCGMVTAWIYNRYREVQLPAALSFFGGRRFVPMLGILLSIPIAFVFIVIWPWLQFALISFGKWIASSTAIAAVGAGLYGIVNRFMQPFGLHHILNTFLWFQMPIEGVNVHTGQAETIFGDINAFQNAINTSGTFTTGYFPMFLGGLPATAAAMVLSAKKERRSQVWTFLSGVAFVAFLTGIDEPLVFSFIFVSPLLWAVNAFFTGILSSIVISMGIHVGFGFSAGMIDYIISFKNSWDISVYNIAHVPGTTIFSNPLWILVLAVLAFAMYFPTFYFIIKYMNVPTPGRTDDAVGNAAIKESVVALGKSVSGKSAGKEIDSKLAKYENLASVIIEEVGIDNFKVIENCTTRLRLVVKNNKDINDAKIKAAGAYAIKRLGTEGYQIVVGTDVEHVTNAVNRQLSTRK